ncbi:MAG: hypothetical protein V4664_02660 [Patescibacteria group bacterium]
MKKRNISQSGVSTLEIIIALAILVIVMTGVIVVLFSNQSIVVDNELGSRATTLASRQIEQAFASSTSVAVFNSLVSMATTTEDVFKKKIDIVPISECVKRVDSTVSWTQGLRPLVTSFSSLLVSTGTAALLGMDCDTHGPSSDNDWDNPTSDYTWDFSPSGSQATDIDVIKRGNNTYALLTSKSGSISQDDFWIVDVTNPSSPQKVAGLDTGEDLNALDVVGDYVFVASASTTAQLQVIDISTIASPNVVATRSLTGPTCSGKKGKKDLTCVGRTLYYYNERIYFLTLDTESENDSELHIFNTTTPSNPGEYGNGIDLGFLANDIIVRGNYAYVASSKDNGELIVGDVSVPAAPVEVATYNLDGTGDATALYVLGKRLYIGREDDTFGGADEFLIFNITTFSNPVEITSQDFDLKLCYDKSHKAQKCLSPNNSIEGIIVSGNFAFISTSDQTNSFQVWQVLNDVITPRSTCNAINYAEKTTSMDYQDNRIFVSKESNTALIIIYDDLSVCGS